MELIDSFLSRNANSNINFFFPQYNAQMYHDLLLMFYSKIYLNCHLPFTATLTLCNMNGIYCVPAADPRFSGLSDRIQQYIAGEGGGILPVLHVLYIIV